MADDDQRARIASILKRLTFGPRPGDVDGFGDIATADLVDQLLAAVPSEPEPPELGTDDDYTAVREWWIRQMLQPGAGLHERMVWFWHTHLTSSLDKAEPALMFRQHKLLRTHALGNFASLLQEITVDAAMLYWLDGASNTAEAPNENYSRELMELFALGNGRGVFDEQDVRNGAMALAGWWVDDENGLVVTFDEEAALQGSVEFLGSTVRNAADVVDTVCNHPACAPFIAGKIHSYLVGSPPTEQRASELAAVFVANDLEIRPLVEAVVRHDSFLTAEYTHPRSGLEWYLAMCQFYETEIDLYSLEGLGQLPMEPPNVAGWPNPARWISASAVFEKASTAWDYSDDLPTLNSDDPVAEVLAKAGLYHVSDETRAALTEAAQSVEGRRELSTVLHALVACSPEFSMI